jgi:hypothetical protein
MYKQARSVQCTYLLGAVKMTSSGRSLTVLPNAEITVVQYINYDA